MSLAFLKNFLFSKSTPLKDRLSTRREAIPRSSYNHATNPPLHLSTLEDQYWVPFVVDADVESQLPVCPKSEEKAVWEIKTDEKEGCKINGRVISDAIIGLSDGLTVPFALTAGLSALGDTKVVVYGGLAELIAGAISMGLGGYLGAKSEEESYKATMEQTRQQIATSPTTVAGKISSILSEYDIPNSTVQVLVSSLSDSPKCVDFLMRFEHALPEPAGYRAITCAMTIASGYFIGGFVPLVPYMLVDKADRGLYWSISIMIIALFVFGYVKTCLVIGWHGWRNSVKGAKGGAQMVVVGSVAAGAAMGLVIAFDHNAGAKSGGA